jgi:hypothetical protein
MGNNIVGVVVEDSASLDSNGAQIDGSRASDEGEGGVGVLVRKGGKAKIAGGKIKGSAKVAVLVA